MRSIWKYVLPLQAGFTTHGIPEGAIFRFAGRNPQLGMLPGPLELAVWFDVNPAAEKVKAHDFLIAGTGSSVPHVATYLGSVPYDEFMWHVFEVPRNGDQS